MSKYLVNWNQKELMAAISGRVASGMGRACAFAAAQAQAKAPRRTGLLSGQISYEVRVVGRGVWGWIGVRKGRAFYGYFHELGTRKMAAHPFLRPAVFGNGPEIVRRIARG